MPSQPNSPSNESANNDRRSTPPHVVLPRLMWVFFGPFGLMLAALSLVTGKGGWATPASIIYLVLVGAMIGGRYLEQRSGYGLNAAAEPCTWEDFRKYVRTMVPSLVGLWVVLNVVVGLLK